MANLYLGYNHMLTGNILVGAQVEGGLSNMRTRLTGPFVEPFQFNSTIVFAGTTTQSASSELMVGNTTDHLDNRWMLSALLRAGLVADPQDLLLSHRRAHLRALRVRRSDIRTGRWDDRRGLGTQDRPRMDAEGGVSLHAIPG
jgi:hypothetical protein